ncbi:hypothetical protein LMG29739_05532 [Paraburkholderia solisilvae]|uniref:Uncharacterized protein n=1 Tax=Paraburkholderia solisilvae TaxID=624376 RepID=A0A6J5EW60_9BURK|nr:hypothetical protein LMG29739_05532 [Paraburkholderia solisilvae]
MRGEHRGLLQESLATQALTKRPAWMGAIREQRRAAVSARRSGAPSDPHDPPTATSASTEDASRDSTGATTGVIRRLYPAPHAGRSQWPIPTAAEKKNVR